MVIGIARCFSYVYHRLSHDLVLAGEDNFQKDGESWFISFAPVNASGYALAMVVPRVCVNSRVFVSRFSFLPPLVRFENCRFFY